MGVSALCPKKATLCTTRAIIHTQNIRNCTNGELLKHFVHNCRMWDHEKLAADPLQECLFLASCGLAINHNRIVKTPNRDEREVVGSVQDESVLNNNQPLPQSRSIQAPKSRLCSPLRVAKRANRPQKKAFRPTAPDEALA